MSVEWTDEQLQAINKNGCNILVAAAAGSGKTTILVERIIKRIIVDKVDIDKLLVVTFTNAAASEMREKILTKLYEKIEQSPDNRYLQRQILLLNKANISTIHAFCLEVIKNYFYEIDISPNFRLGDTSEINILKEQALEEVFEELYESKDRDFIKLVNIYGGYRGDEQLKDLILKIYNYSQSNPFPEEWITNSIEMFNLEIGASNDFSSTVWGKVIIDFIKEEIENAINILKQIRLELEDKDFEKFFRVVCDDISNLDNCLKLRKWDDFYNGINNIKFLKWPIDKKVDSEIKDFCKEKRDLVKKKIKDIQSKYLSHTSTSANSDIYEMYKVLIRLGNVIFKFFAKYKELKREKNIIDFNDIEHYALKILVKKDSDGNYRATDIAKEYQNKFEEIAIDEYQDSNLVQEYILSTISKNNNIFMVGDVKQSIYKFRQARPEIFLEKYDAYVLSGNEKIGDNTKIQLFKNFRSKSTVLDVVNLIFKDIMSKKLGDINYNKEEFLNLGSQFPEKNEPEKDIAELNIISLSSEEDNEVIEKNEIEASFVAKRISEILNSGYKVFDKKCGYRQATFRDIVILLRTTSNVAQIYENELAKFNYPVFCDVSNNYFETMEVKTMMSVLQIIDNPDNDIPLVAVLRSPIGNFTDNELAEIRKENFNKSFFRALVNSKDNNDNSELKIKIYKFVNMLKDWQLHQEYLELDELIWYIYENTGYYNYVQLLPDGELRTANLRLLFEKAKEYEKASFKGLYNFINYINKLSQKNQDGDSAKLIGENDNVIRIMSIHKSKGLEFPIVFLCNTGKQFNMQDLTQDILLHQDLGFGPTYINYEKKIQYNTLAKEAIKIKLKNEIISEEMRLLYVALTRSKEKLIITGVEKDLEKTLNAKQKELEVEEKTEKINLNIVKKAKSYLDWLEYVCLYNRKIEEILKIRYETNTNGKNWIKEKRKLEIIESKVSSETEKKLAWQYKNLQDTIIEGKTSVSKISKDDESITVNKPKILNENIEITNAEKGTIMHLILQKLNFNNNYDKGKIETLIKKLVDNNIITRKEAVAVDINKIYKFTQSDLFKKIKQAEKVYKEKPFYINIPAKILYNEKTDENILVQGIIDLYFIDKYGKIILVDYKTDYVKKDEELIEKYKTQLNYYKQALEQALHKSVDEIYIYSLFLNKEIIVK